MRKLWLTLAFTALIACFVTLGFDFYRLISSGGQISYLRLSDVWSSSILTQLDTWANLEKSTWGNTVRLGLRPLMITPPQWVLWLVLALIFRIFARKPRS